MEKKSLIPFFKVVGSGNDFVLVDARKKPLRRIPQLAKAWCDRHLGIGADGLLVVMPSKKGLARMRIYNPDGSHAEMCGNGLRCVAWYLHTAENRKKQFDIETDAGVMAAEVTGKERIRLTFNAPKNIQLRKKLLTRDSNYVVHSVNTGVPHTILLVPRLVRANLASIGPAIRFHKAFGTAGTNVDLVQIISDHKIGILGSIWECCIPAKQRNPDTIQH